MIVAFHTDACFESLWRYFVRGWKFSKTRLSDEYDYDRFVDDLPEDGMQLLLMTDAEDVEFIAADQQVTPGPGTTIVYFASERKPAPQELKHAPSAAV